MALLVWKIGPAYYQVLQARDAPPFRETLTLVWSRLSWYELCGERNVMIMAVYERVREIETIAAIGTLPRKILLLFLVEGFCLGVAGAITGVLVGLGIISMW